MAGFEVALTCLALNVFKEARGEPIAGQHAVALVTLNRVSLHGLRKDVCDIVFESKQFSWTITDSNSGVLHKNKIPDQNSVEWKRAKQSAMEALYMKDFTCGATHYHAVQSRPVWRQKMEYVGQWGSHYFYRGNYGNQYQTEGAGRGAGNSEATRANCPENAGGSRAARSGESYRPTEPKPECGRWKRLIEHLWPSDRNKKTGSLVHQHVVEPVRRGCTI